MPYLRCDNCKLTLYRAGGRFARETCPGCRGKLTQAAADVHEWLAHSMLSEGGPAGRPPGQGPPRPRAS